ncbi:hypothetical protein PspLS_09629 [Pyricularia sp. CBS 133598]|nr:hypothetical protein PspLS_09629 [Pyricularia sp. CBS 133598]
MKPVPLQVPSLGNWYHWSNAWGLRRQQHSSLFVTREAKRHGRLPKAAVVGASESGEQTAGEAEDPSAGQSRPLGPIWSVPLVLAACFVPGFCPAAFICRP